MTISRKISVALIFLSCVILATGLVDLSGIATLSNQLRFLTGPAWDTADGAVIAEANSGAQNQKSQTEQVASAMTEMVATVLEVSAYAQSASEVSRCAGERAESGNGLMHQTSDQIHRLAEGMQSASDTIDEVKASTESMDVVLRLQLHSKRQRRT